MRTRSRRLRSAMGINHLDAHNTCSHVQFLTKQTATLKRLNESRVRVYEQIETSLSELEENHNKLSEESAWEKVKIKR